MASRLTDAQIRGAKPRERPHKLADGAGLYLLVNPTGSRLWRYRYRLAGVENTFAVGEYPDMGLSEARQARDDARRLVKQGKHPAHDRAARRQQSISDAANTFANVAMAWVEQNRSHWKTYYLQQVETVMEKDVFPSIGRLPIKGVTVMTH